MIENPIVCANINKIGFRMCGGFAAYETPSHREFRAIAMSVYASGAIPPGGHRVGRKLPGHRSIVFGASTRAHIRETKSLVDDIWGPPGT